jgi:hypothetical protein
MAHFPLSGQPRNPPALRQERKRPAIPHDKTVSLPHFGRAFRFYLLQFALQGAIAAILVYH